MTGRLALRNVLHERPRLQSRRDERHDRIREHDGCVDVRHAGATVSVIAAGNGRDGLQDG